MATENADTLEENYIDGRKAELFRNIRRLYEDYCGDDPAQYPQRTEDFGAVLWDVRLQLLDATERKAFEEANSPVGWGNEPADMNRM